MIKAPYSIAELDKIAKMFAKEIKTEFTIQAKINGRAVDALTPVLAVINGNLDTILTGYPDKLEAIIIKITPLEKTAKANYRAANAGKTTKEINKWYKTQILQIFNYDLDHRSFTKVRDGELAYRHAQRLNLPTCPYCNAQFTFTTKNKNFKTRPHFDHFFSKSKHPYLALSFYNLIPACYICNSNLKGSKPFTYTSHLHPFMESIDGLYKFRTNITSVDFLVNKKSFKITAVPNKKANPVNLSRAKRSITDFAIEDRYNYHKDYAGEVITKSYFYNTTTIKELFKDYEIRPGVKLFSSESEIIELLFGNYIQENKLHKRILSKITKDIAEEFGITV